MSCTSICVAPGAASQPGNSSGSNASSAAQADTASGKAPAAVCGHCVEAFSGKRPWLCKYALANDLWLGRPDPLRWKANMTHEMCLALARTVATKVALRARGASQSESSSSSGSRRDYVFQQSGLVGFKMAALSTRWTACCIASSMMHWPCHSVWTCHLLKRRSRAKPRSAVSRSCS